MNRCIKLVYYEFARFRLIYFSLMAVTILLQFVGLYLFVHEARGKIYDEMKRGNLTAAQYGSTHQALDLTAYTSHNLWFMAPIALCIAALLFYTFMIWYRDWLGKNMFIYRLLMLPTSRMQIYAAKLIVIILSVLGLIALQLLAIPLLGWMFNAMMPDVFAHSISMFMVITDHPLLSILIPPTFFEFVLYYGAGAVSVTVIFTAILMERSFRWKGILAGVLYCGAAIFIFILPILIAAWTGFYPYPSEALTALIVIGILIGCGSLRLSSILLKNKVSV